MHTNDIIPAVKCIHEISFELMPFVFLPHYMFSNTSYYSNWDFPDHTSLNVLVTKSHLLNSSIVFCDCFCRLDQIYLVRQKTHTPLLLSFVSGQNMNIYNVHPVKYFIFKLNQNFDADDVQTSNSKFDKNIIANVSSTFYCNVSKLQFSISKLSTSKSWFKSTKTIVH